jgi:hypothetical protein
MARRTNSGLVAAILINQQEIADLRKRLNNAVINIGRARKARDTYKARCKELKLYVNKYQKELAEERRNKEKS